MKFKFLNFKLGIFAALIFILIFSGQIAHLLTEWRWFQSVEYSSVYGTMLKARLGIFIGSALIFGVLSFVNLRLIPERPRYFSLMIIVISALFGLVMQFGWARLLLALNAQPFSVNDPLFGMDLGFYIFTLPLLWALWSAIFAVILINLAITAGAYLFHQINELIIRPEEMDFAEIARSIHNRGQAHLAALLGLLALLFSLRYLLERYEIFFSETGVVYGAGYADVYAHLPLLGINAAVALLVALLLFAFAAGYRSTKVPLIIGVLVVGTVGIGVIYPAAIQQYRVSPNEIVMEAPFIAHNINYTRLAYGIEGVAERPFMVDYNLTGSDLRANSKTVDNIRLWDWRPLLNTYKQLQEIRTYYEFMDVDVDRYIVDGQNRQVMISARELSLDRLSEQAKTWQNMHLFYTHGYGVVMSPANAVTPEGLPEFFIKNLPPESVLGEMTRPEIYYGEGEKDYVVVNTGLPEFDYPLGDENVYTTNNGTGGIMLDPVMRLLMAYRLGSVNLFLSDDVTSESRVLIHRNVVERAKTVAPFLAYDNDPYIVLASGRLFWVLDAYTLTGRFPYSTPTGGFNYIRNPVKVVIDAYNGDIWYYVVEDEPIVRAYEAIFPDLFLPLDAMPEELRAHIRYPVDLFKVQAEIYRNYHMTEPQTFYNREDSWDIPVEVYRGVKQNVEPYYVIMKTPGSDEGEEFILIQPFTPRSRNNMIAWMCGKSDPPNYGERLVFKFPKDQLIFGPMQIEARIDQNTDISEQLTLWSQVGSNVLRGNILVIPINNSLLYVEPLYLRAEASELPELKRVIVAYGSTVVMDESLGGSLSRIFDFESETPSAAPVRTGDAKLSLEDLIGLAKERYSSAQERLRAGNWSGYGEEIEGLGEVIQTMEGRFGA